MSVNIKLGEDILENKDTVKIPLADDSGNLATFSLGIGHTITFTVDGESYVTQQCVDGKSIMAPLDPVVSGKAFTGWYIGANNVSFPYTPTQDVTITAGLVTAEWCTIAGLGSSSPSSVTFTKSSGWSDDYETVTMPSATAGEVDTFKKFPTMWRKIDTSASGQITGVTIATAQIDDSYHVYPCFLAEDSVTILPYVLMGVSCSNSSSSCNSIDGYTSSAAQAIATGRTNARARGTGYQQMDWMIFKLWQDLLICAMKTVNTNKGSGITTDALGIYWGNNYPWVDGVTHNGSSKKFIFSYKPSKYINEATPSTDDLQNPPDYVQTSYTYSGTNGDEIQKLGYDPSNEFFNYPVSTTSNSSYNTYYCDGFYFGTSGTNPVRSVVGLADARRGAFGCAADDAWSYSRGVRLCYRPLVTT